MNKIMVKGDFSKTANINADQYKKMYEASIKDPEKFWGEVGLRLDWFKKFTAVKQTSFKKPVSINWYGGGELNASFNCIDRHLAKNADKIALVWEADDPKTPSRKITYQELHDEVCRMANVLKAQGVKKGDVVTIYLPMIPEAVYAMQACARIGAIHSVIFGGFSPDSISTRINDGASQFVITADEGLRGGKIVPLKENVDEALKKTKSVKKVLVVRHTEGKINWQKDRDLWWHEERKS